MSRIDELIAANTMRLLTMGIDATNAGLEAAAQKRKEKTMTEHKYTMEEHEALRRAKEVLANARPGRGKNVEICINSHDALVEALKATKTRLEEESR